MQLSLLYNVVTRLQKNLKGQTTFLKLFLKFEDDS